MPPLATQQKPLPSANIAACRDEIAEYPDFVLSVGERGGVSVEKA
jgi:hypothetical protein